MGFEHGLIGGLVLGHLAHVVYWRWLVHLQDRRDEKALELLLVDDQVDDVDAIWAATSAQAAGDRVRDELARQRALRRGWTDE